MPTALRLAVPVVLGLLSLSIPAEEGESVRVYLGTYTGHKAKGIYVSELNLASGALSEPRLAAETVNPTFLALDPKGRFLYAVNEVKEFEGQKGGMVSAFAIAPQDGALTLLNQRSSKGAGPCHLVLDAAGRHVLLANYSGGSVAVLPVGEDGKLGEATSVIKHEGSSVNPKRQKQPYAHSIYLDPTRRFAVSADLGADKLFVYRFDAQAGTLTPHGSATLAPGSGPRHCAFHTSGRFAYAINELNSTITAFAWDGEQGRFSEIQVARTIPDDFTKDNWTAEVQVHPSGKFLYGSNREHDSLALFRIDAQTGKLTPAGHAPTGGVWPRNFGIEPSGKFVIAANQKGDNLRVFRVDLETGALTPVGKDLALGAPVCVKFLPLAR